MPQIPQFQPDPVPQPAPLPRINPAAASAGFGEMADVAGEFDRRYAEASRQAAAADATASAFSQIDQIEHKYSLVPDRDAALAGYQNEVAALKGQTLSAIDDPEVKAHVTQMFDARAATGFAQTGDAAFQRQASMRDATLDQQMNSYAHQYAAAGSDTERVQIKGAATAAVNGAVSAGWIMGDAGERHLLNFQVRADDALARQDINTDAATAVKKLSDPAQYPMLDPILRERLLYQAQNRAGSQAAVNAGQVRQAFEDNLASLERTGEPAVALSPAAIRAAYPDQADQMLDQLRRAGQLNAAVNRIALTSPQEDAQIAASWQPRGSGYAAQARDQDVIYRAIDQKNRALTQDPAGYVLNAAPDIRSAFATADRNPAAIPAAVKALDAAYDRLGVPEDNRRVLPYDQASRLVSQITAAPPDQAATTMQQLAGQYGPEWPRVFGDLASAKLPQGYQVIAAVDDGGARTDLVEAMRAGPKALKSMVAPEDDKAVTQGIPDTMAPFLHTLALAPNGAQLGEAWKNAAEVLSLRYVSQGMAPKDAMTRAVNGLVASKWDIADGAGYNARAPRGSLATVEGIAEGTLSNLKPGDVWVPPQAPGGVPLTDQQRAEAYLRDGVKAGSLWVTNPQDDGWMLLDSTRRPVLRPDGRTPVGFKFQDALDVAAANAAAARAGSSSAISLPMPAPSGATP